MGVLIFEGMKVGLLPGDLTISLDEQGKPTSQFVLSTAYNVVPLWLLAAHDNLKSALMAQKRLKEDWSSGSEANQQRQLLINELVPSMQTVIACGIALDGFYEILKPHAKLSAADIAKWKKNKTSRSAQIFETLRRTVGTPKGKTRDVRKIIKQIIDLRDQAVHPTNRLRHAVFRSDLSVAVDWKFAAFSAENAKVCFTNTMQIFSLAYERRDRNPEIKSQIENIIKSLEALGVVTINDAQQNAQADAG